MTLLDTIVLPISVCILTLGLIDLSIKYLRKRNEFGHYVQLIMLVVVIVSFCLSVYLALGRSVLNSVVTGGTVAIGLALQPLVKTIIPGFIFDGTHIPRGDHMIEVKGIKGKVKQVGLLHTWLSDPDGNLIMLNNGIFETQPVKVYLS